MKGCWAKQFILALPVTAGLFGSCARPSPRENVWHVVSVKEGVIIVRHLNRTYTAVNITRPPHLVALSMVGQDIHETTLDEWVKQGGGNLGRHIYPAGPALLFIGDDDETDTFAVTAVEETR